MRLSLDKLDYYAEINYEVKLFNDRLKVENYDDFVNALYNDIDWCIKEVQSKAKFLQPDQNGEDRVSAFLQGVLKGMLYSAHAEFVTGGNTDLTIKSLNNEFLWIGEAKLVSSVDNTHIWGGFLQLVTRYTSGDNPNGGLLIYIYTPDANSIMDKYKDFTVSKTEYEFRYEDCPTRKTGGFYTVHRHHASGLDFKTRHIPVILHYDPQK